MTNPDLAGAVVHAFGAKLPIPNKSDIARVCRKRIEQAKKLIDAELQNQELLKMVGIQPDNANLSASILSQIRPQIFSKEPYHQQKMMWLSELLDTDEMMFADKEMREFIGAMIDRHQQEMTLGLMQIQQDQSTAGIIANLPMLLGEQAMNQQNQAMVEEQQQAQMAQQQQQAAQNEQALQMKQQEADIAEKSASAQRQHEETQGKVAHDRALQLKAMDVLAQAEKPVAKAS